MKLNRIKKVLIDKDLSQSWLAKQMKLSTQSINDLCQNRSQPSLKRLYRIADILQVPVCDLLVDNEIVEPSE